MRKNTKDLCYVENEQLKNKSDLDYRMTPALDIIRQQKHHGNKDISLLKWSVKLEIKKANF
jgi:hypothetical protein